MLRVLRLLGGHKRSRCSRRAHIQVAGLLLDFAAHRRPGRPASRLRPGSRRGRGRHRRSVGARSPGVLERLRRRCRCGNRPFADSGTGSRWWGRGGARRRGAPWGVGSAPGSRTPSTSRAPCGFGFTSIASRPYFRPLASPTDGILVQEWPCPHRQPPRPGRAGSQRVGYDGGCVTERRHGDLQDDAAARAAPSLDRVPRRRLVVEGTAAVRAPHARA